MVEEQLVSQACKLVCEIKVSLLRTFRKQLKHTAAQRGIKNASTANCVENCIYLFYEIQYP